MFSLSAFGQAFTFSDIPFMGQQLFLSDWPARVVANGGAVPSVNSTNSVNIFYTHLVKTGLTNKLISVIGFAPDSIIAATTPIYFQAGASMWTNINFGASNLTVNGLQGNATDKYLDSRINVSTLSAGGFGDLSAGISMMIYSDTNSVGDEFGSLGTLPSANSIFALSQAHTVVAFNCWLFTSVNAGFVNRAPPHANWSGYLSGNRTAADAIRLDMVTNGVFNIYTNAISTVAGNNNDTITNLTAFAIWQPNTTPATRVSFSDSTVSFIAVHAGLTFTESSNLAVGVFQLRTNFGGGVPVAQ